MNNIEQLKLHIDTKTKRSVLWRWLFRADFFFNYEKMQALAYCYAVLPFLKIAYKNKPEALQKAVINHLQF